MEEQWWLQLVLVGLLAGAAALLVLQQRSRRKIGRRLPPGPPGMPLFGNLFLFIRSKQLHADFYKLAETYGPLMWLRLGSRGMVLVQSPAVAEEMLKHQDATFASRPPRGYTIGLVFSKGRDVGFEPYGPHWRLMRKLMTVELLSNKRIMDLQHVRVEEVGRMVEAIGRHLGQPVDLGYLLQTLNLNNITRMGMSKAAITTYQVHNPQHKANSATQGGKFDSVQDPDHDRELITIVREVTDMLSVKAIGDAVPWLSFLDTFILPKAKFEHTVRKLQNYFSKVIQEHRQYQAHNPGSQPRDFLDVMLSQVSSSSHSDGEAVITDADIKALLMDMLIAGTDTSSVTVEWAMAELLRHPADMEHAVQELDRVVGAGRAVSEADVANLPFLQAVVKETMRMHPAAPFLPHYSTQDASVGGYHIPANTTVYVNVWALGRDPAYWPHPHRFQPGRFLATGHAGGRDDVDLRGHHFQLLPFGAGKRLCAGMSLGLAVTHYSLATLLHTFRWSLPADVARPDDLDMSERQGLTLYKASALQAVPHPVRVHVAKA